MNPLNYTYYALYFTYLSKEDRDTGQWPEHKENIEAKLQHQVHL